MYKKEILIDFVNRSGLLRNEIAERLEMSEKAFEEALNGRSEFKALQIFRLVELLNIREPGKIFFAD